MSEMSVKEGLTAMDVASYLRRHPEFLNEFPDLALALRLPREQDRPPRWPATSSKYCATRTANCRAACTTSSRSRTRTSSSWCACTRSRCR